MNAQVAREWFVGVPLLFVVMPSFSGPLALVLSIVDVVRAGTSPDFAVSLVLLGALGGEILGIVTILLVLALRFALVKLVRGSVLDLLSGAIASLPVPRWSMR
jgi:hypothetical protein